MYLGIYILLGVVAMITLAMFCWFVYGAILELSLIPDRQLILVIAPRVGSKLHSVVLRHAFLFVKALFILFLNSHFYSAPLSFLTQTDTGTILNRFSQDMQLIDFQLTFAGLNTAECEGILTHTRKTNN